MMRSTMIPETTAAAEEEEFKNRKCREDNARYFMHGNITDAKVLEKACQRRGRFSLLMTQSFLILEMRFRRRTTTRRSDVPTPHKNKFLLIMPLSLIRHR